MMEIYIGGHLNRSITYFSTNSFRLFLKQTKVIASELERHIFILPVTVTDSDLDTNGIVMTGYLDLDQNWSL